MSISLLGSINVCKVNSGYADKIQSDRFENPDTMTCPLWNGQDSFGRYVHPDSFYTKNAGCNSADDRVSIENFLRPQYMEYVALDAAGFRSPNVFGGNPIKENWNGNEKPQPFAPDNQYNYNAQNRMAQAYYQANLSNTMRCNSGF